MYRYTITVLPRRGTAPRLSCRERARAHATLFPRGFIVPKSLRAAAFTSFDPLFPVQLPRRFIKYPSRILAPSHDEAPRVDEIVCPLVAASGVAQLRRSMRSASAGAKADRGKGTSLLNWKFKSRQFLVAATIELALQDSQVRYDQATSACTPRQGRRNVHLLVTTFSCLSSRNDPRPGLASRWCCISGPQSGRELQALCTLVVAVMRFADLSRS